MKARITERLNTIIKEAKRPFVCLLVLCMIVTLIPSTGLQTGIEGVYADATEITSLDFSGGSQCTISEDTILTAAETITAGKTLTIENGCTLTITENLTIAGNATINGSGRLKTSGASIRVTGILGTTLNIDGITIEGSTWSMPMMYYDADTARETINFNDVTITGSHIVGDGSDQMSSVITINQPVTVTMRDTVITGNSGGLGAVYLYDNGASLELEGNVIIADDSDPSALSQGGISFASANTTGRINVTGALSATANIAVNKTNRDTSPVHCDGSAYVDSALAAFYISDDFHNYGFTASGTDLVYTPKQGFTVTYTGDGDIDIQDAHNRSIVTASGGGTVNAMELPSRAVNMIMLPATADDFLKTVSVETSAHTVIASTAGITQLGSVARNKQLGFSFPAGGTANVVFDKAITNVTLSGILAPKVFATAGASLANADIDELYPNTATATISSIGWYDGTNHLMGASETFAINETYTLRMVITATSGSKMAESVEVNALSQSFTVTGDESAVTAEKDIEAEKQTISEAIANGDVIITIDPGDGTYDGATNHGPTVTIEDKNGGNSAVSVRPSGASSYTEVSDQNYSYSTVGGSRITTATGVYAARNASTYALSLMFINNNYKCTGTDEYTRDVSFTIAKASLVPASLSFGSAATKYYDGYTTASGITISFTGLVGTDTMTLGSTYTADFNYASADAGGNKTVNATGITLLGDALTNYTLSGSTLSGSNENARILKVTPQAIEPDAVSFAAINATGKTLADVGLMVGSWFTNIFNTSLHVAGTIQIVSPATINTSVDPMTATALDTSTSVVRNRQYTWLFTPSDTTNYYATTGTAVLWPVEPITSVVLTGITFPEAGVVNTTTLSGITVVCGPSASSSVTITSIEILENGAVQRPFNYGETFKYNESYLYVINFQTGEGDSFATTQNALTVTMVSGSAARIYTQETVTSTTVHSSWVGTTDKGTLDSSYFNLTPAAYVYDGNLHPITFSAITKTAIDTINDALLKYKTAVSDYEFGSEGVLNGYTDVTMNPAGTANVPLAVYLQLQHPDYTYAGGQWLELTSNMKITPKPITNVTISEVIQKPYDGTDEVEVVLTSSDIVPSDVGNVTFSAVAHISNVNVTSGIVTVTAESIQMGGSRAFNYVLSPAAMTVTTTGNLNVIQKATPTGGSITWSAVTTANPHYSDLNVTPQDFVNPVGSQAVAGSIETYYFSDFTSLRVPGDNVEKRHTYYWKFVPNDSTNYNPVTGSAVYWEGAPITNATLTGIVLPVATANPTAQSQISLELNDPTANITISGISWNETSDIEGVSDRAIGMSDAFYYNRYHILTITLSAVGEGGAAPVDEFNDEAAIVNSRLIPTFAGIINIGGQLQPCVTEIIKTNGKAYTAVITCSFGGVKTDKGTLTLNNLEFRDFASYTEQNGTTAFSDGLRGEYTGQSNPYSYAYVYTGRWVGPNPKVYALGEAIAPVESIQAPELAVFTYSTNGGSSYQTQAPRYKNKMDPVQIRIKLEHPDYNSATDIVKDINFQIGPCTIRPEGIDYAGKYYDGTTAITGAKILWYPQSSGFDGITSQAISEDLVDYTANFVFDGENAGNTKNVIVTNISATSENFICQIDDLPAKHISKQSETSFTYTGGVPIWKAAVTPKTGSILKQPINSAVSLSAVYTDYIINHSNASTGAVMVNAVRSSLDVHGSLDFMSGGAIMSYADMDSATLVQGQAYTWCFTPTDAVNYAVTTGTQILWPFPPPTPSYGGGGGGGGAAAPTKAAVSTLSGVIATPGNFSTQIHVYWASGGSIVTDKAFLARVTGAAVDRALTAMPDGNIVVDRDGNIIVKAIIEGGMVKAYLTGDNYLTVQRRKVDYIDVPGHWFEPYVDFCSARDIMNGTGESKFSPNDTLTRAMAATIIYRLEGALALDGSERHFADVEDGKWYSDGIAWAGGNGIVNGIGIKNFAPHWDITREQLAVMIYNYCRTRCGAEAVPSGYFDARLYNDGGQIASWAQEAVAYCSKVGLMKGNDKGDFCPKDTATRAEFATITQRLIEAFLDGKL